MRWLGESGIGAAARWCWLSTSAIATRRSALLPDDIADAVVHIVTCDRRVAVNEMLIRAAEQTW